MIRLKNYAIVTTLVLNVSIPVAGMQSVKTLANRSVMRTQVFKTPATLPQAVGQLRTNSSLVKITCQQSLHHRRIEPSRAKSIHTNWWQICKTKFSAIAALTTLSAIAIATQQAAQAEENNKQKPWETVETRYLKALEDEETAILKEIQESLHLTADELAAKKEEYARLYEQSISSMIKQDKQKYPDPVSPKFIKAICRLLQENGIDTNSVMFVNYPDGDPMAVAGIPGNYAVFINETQCNPLDTLELEGVILHEIQHLKHNDPSLTFIREQLGTNEAIAKYFTFIERRADILAGLTHPKYAYGLAHIFGRVSASIDKKHAKGFHHDSYEVRAAYMKKLYEEIIDAIPQEQRKQYCIGKSEKPNFFWRILGY